MRNVRWGMRQHTKEPPIDSVCVRVPRPWGDTACGGQINRYARFSLSFDPSGGSMPSYGGSARFALRRGATTAAAHRRPLQWECVNFRGVDKSIADLTVLGFGGRTLG